MPDTTRTQDEHRRFVCKKAHEICYAVLRISSRMERKTFASHIEDRGLSLLEHAILEDYGKIQPVANVLSQLLQVGADAGIIHQSNFYLLKQELGNLLSATAEIVESLPLPREINLGGVFSAESPFSADSMEIAANREGCPAAISGNTAINSPAPHDNILGNGLSNGSSLENGNNGRSVIKAAIRQSAILERIRQNGKLHDGVIFCRMKELQDVLPSVSERTIRYDLQNLVEQGVIERIGNGGPSTCYRAKEGH